MTRRAELCYIQFMIDNNYIPDTPYTEPYTEPYRRPFREIPWYPIPSPAPTPKVMPTWDFLGTAISKQTEKLNIVCDLDGTLADCDHRLPYIIGREEKDWEGYFTYQERDMPITPIIKLLKLAGGHVTVLTGRPERYRKVSTEWLKRHEIPFDTLTMRKNSDRRPNHIYKGLVLKQLSEDKGVDLFIDNNLFATEIAAGLGIHSLFVQGPGCGASGSKEEQSPSQA